MYTYILYSNSSPFDEISPRDTLIRVDDLQGCAADAR